MAAERPVWFEENGTGGVEIRVLPPPKHVLKAHQQFKKRVRKALRIGKQEVKIASTKDELNKQIEDVQNGQSHHAIALATLDDASKSHEIYVQGRKQGLKRVGRWAQEFANGFSEFVSAYSGIVDIVQGAGGPYGEVAYQTLSILLIVVVNKSSNDKKIKDLLDDLRKSFPRLENWSDIYPTQTMRVLVATVYEQVTEFSRAAAEYFTEFWRRFTMAIIAPPSVGIDKVAAFIHKTLAEINSEAMYGLHGRSQNIETQVVRSGETIKQLQAQVIDSGDTIKQLKVHAERMEANNDELLLALQEQRNNFEAYKKDVERRAQQEDEQRLRALEEELGVTFPSAETNVDQTRKSLMKVFPNSPHYSSHMPITGYIQMNRSLLHESEEYRSWISSTESCMLFLSGRTVREGRYLKGLTHGWLSPAAIYLVEDLAREGINVAFYSCHPDLESKPGSLKHIISSIVLQVLKRKPQILREKAVQFHSAIRSDPWLEANALKTQARAIMKLLGSVLEVVKDLGTTFIIIDRLDMIDRLGQREGQFRVVMDELVRLVGDRRCNVKFAIIADTSYGGGEWKSEYLPEGEYRLDRVFKHQEWNQRLLTNQEMNRAELPLTWGSAKG